MIIVQLILYCALFTLMVKLGVRNSALNGLFFYPKPVRAKVYALGLTDRQTVGRKRKRFMIAFFAVMGAALVLIIRVWNGIHGGCAARDVQLRPHGHAKAARDADPGGVLLYL